MTKSLRKKIEEIDITEEKEECENKKLKLAHVQLEKQKIDFGNTLKQIKDSFNSRLNSQQETINSLAIRSQSGYWNTGLQVSTKIQFIRNIIFIYFEV